MPAAYDPNLATHRSWIPVPEDHDFPIQNLPFGMFEAPGRGVRPGVRIGDFILDLMEAGLAEDASLVSLMPRAREIRSAASWLLNAANPDRLKPNCLVDHREAQMHLPCPIGDYVDFYSSLEHATNVGRMFRDPERPLLPNWRWLPIGYHGRAGTVQISGTPVRRPHGQISRDNETAVFGPSLRLDIELEMAFLTGVAGSSLSPEEAQRSIFGLVLMNDWSARDIQRWEYVPLGPFLGKSFLTTISPWVVTADALEPFRVAGPPQSPAPLTYLQQAEPRNYDIHLEIWLQPHSDGEAVRIARTNFRHMYWSCAQQLAHLTSNGATIRPGDLCGSGTVSGPEPGSFGSLLELAWNGTKPISLPGGGERSFLQDGDTVILKGWCEGAYRIGFGECRGTVAPA
jgi:fumarylacetoacetase